MTVLCDTSVLVASILTEQPHYLPSVRFMEGIQNNRLKAAVAAHSLAECYSVLTASTSVFVLSALEVLEVIKKNIHYFEIIELGVEDYWECLSNLSTRNFRSGVVYDALILQTAIKKKIPRLVTWNVKHFERLAAGRVEVVTPQQA